MPYSYGYYSYGEFLANNVYFLLLIPVFLLSIWAQIQVSGNFRRYSQAPNRRRITGAQAEIAGQRFKVYRTAPGQPTDRQPGTVLSAGKRGIEVSCGDGRSLYLTEIQAEGGKRMSAAAYLLGHPMEV